MLIRREIEVTRKRLNTIIDVTYGTELLPIELNITDYQIPEGASAVAYAESPGVKPRKLICDIEDNTIILSPVAGFFEVGKNDLQVRIVYDNKSLFSFKCKVNCQESYLDDDAEEVASQPTILEQVLSKIGNMSELLDKLSKGMDLSTLTMTVTTIENGNRLTLSDGIIEKYVDIPSVSLTNEQISSIVNNWLNEHPEATTTVVDGSITKEKLSEDIKTLIEALTEETVTSADYVEVTSVSLNRSSVNGTTGASVQLIASVLPSNATDKRVIWDSSDKSVATVDDNGLVTFIKNGTATITATSVSDDYFKASCTVTIAAKFTTVYLFDIEPVESGKIISKVGAPLATGGYYKYYEIPYKEGMTINTCVATPWIANYPPVVIAKNDGTFESLTGETETVDDSTSYCVVSVGSLNDCLKIYVNAKESSLVPKEKYKYTYSE